MAIWCFNLKVTKSKITKSCRFKGDTWKRKKEVKSCRTDLAAQDRQDSLEACCSNPDSSPAFLLSEDDFTKKMSELEESNTSALTSLLLFRGHSLLSAPRPLPPKHTHIGKLHKDRGKEFFVHTCTQKSA